MNKGIQIVADTEVIVIIRECYETLKAREQTLWLEVNVYKIKALYGVWDETGHLELQHWDGCRGNIIGELSEPNQQHGLMRGDFNAPHAILKSPY